ncbi:MAG: glycoside hydrolase family 99-like domain-containing protein, partial [Clostridia bacterium]|nr:glycoside hydrolase family 99-like domain-containing protein [Clostridia bacterium]
MNNKLFLASFITAFALSSGCIAAEQSFILPSQTASVGDVVVAAVRAHAEYHADTSVKTFEYLASDYSDFAEYAIENGIIDKYEFSSYTENVTRIEAAAILSRALPAEYYEKINEVYNIPDISSSNDYYDEALLMYRAGIMVGDENKLFEPDSQIRTGELAQVMNRLVFPEKRADILDEKIREEKQAYLLNYTDNMDGPKEGIESGWELDNRAGSFRTSLSGNGTLVDMMTDESSRLIRHFNVITEDKIDARFRLRISSGFEGNKIEFCDADGNPAYRIVCANDALNLENADGTLTKIADRLSSTELYSFRVIIDFETGLSSTELNNVLLGEHPLIGDEIKYFSYTTSKEEKAILSLVDSYMYSNYTLYEDFHHYTAIPQGFETYGNVSLSGGALVLEPVGTAYKRFNPVAGNVCFSFNTYLPEGTTGTEFALMSDGKAVVSLTMVDGNMYANGTLVKSNVSDKLWHKMRIEADTSTGKAVIKANAKVLATVPFKWEAKHFDEIKLYDGGFDSVKVDDLKVFNIVDYDVPEPVIPGGDDDYIVGMNICSLWINGEHWGWGCVSPYEDMKPVLGYYDEGIPESADWENKFMAEHGIDFQAFCWYANESNAPMKSTRLASQLDEAYLHSKYGDDVKFCLLWEAANASRPANSDAFRNYFVPYWIENYFTDPRYMTIDNKLVFSIFGADQLINVFGTGLKAEFDYMREEVKKLGFDGMIITASHTGKNSLAAYGFDAWQAYNWGTTGYVLQNNINNNINRANSKDVYVIPTVSVGFNSIPWHGIRYPLMTTEDFKSAHEWVRDTYIPQYALTDTKTWNDKLVWLSTWNEYGEGTYIMPSDDLNGFGYLDALREVYTDGGTHTDHVPSEEQKVSFNHLYPQDRRILRAYGNYVATSDSVSKKVIDLTVSGVFDTNFVKGNLQSYQVTSSNGTTMKSLDTGSNDAIINFKGTAYSGFTADSINRIEVVASGIPEGSVMQMFFRTSVSPKLSEGNSVKSKPS